MNRFMFNKIKTNTNVFGVAQYGERRDPSSLFEGQIKRDINRGPFINLYENCNK